MNKKLCLRWILCFVCSRVLVILCFVLSMVCRWCTCCGHTYHVGGGVRSSGFLPRKSWLHPASVSRKRLSVRSIGAFSFSVHVGVPSLRVQWNSRPWYSVSAWIVRRFDRFFFGFFPPSARCFLFGLVDPYPAGVILALGTMFGIQTKKETWQLQSCDVYQYPLRSCELPVQGFTVN